MAVTLEIKETKATNNGYLTPKKEISPNSDASHRFPRSISLIKLMRLSRQYKMLKYSGDNRLTGYSVPLN